MSISHRDAAPDDLKFVVSVWSRTYKFSPAAGIIAHEDWPLVMHGTIRKLIARPGNRTLVAYESDDSDFLYGFICGDTTSRIPVVHYIFVKDVHRRTGIASRLFGALGVLPSESFEYSGWTDMILKMKRVIPYARYVPDRARNPAKEFYGIDEATR